MAKKTGRRPAARRRAPRTAQASRPGFGWLAWLVVAAAVAAGAFFFAREHATGGGEPVRPPAAGLPNTPDYHSLLVDATEPDHLLLGTHVGIYESENGGISWRFAGLDGKDAMHFAREDGGTLWVAGHGVLAKSSDGGRTWSDVRPKGLPGLDIHGFAVSQDVDGLVYAAVAGKGLYRSDDGGAAFRLISRDVGPAVTALAVTKDGVLFAADGDRGVLLNVNGDGDEWTTALDMPTVGLAANPLDPPRRRVLAAGSSLQLTKDGGEWRKVLSAEEGVGPVAFSPSAPDIAYAVGFDRKLYRSNDGGESWRPVG